MAHHDISLRCGIWSLSGHSGLWPAERPVDLWVHGLKLRDYSVPQLLTTLILLLQDSLVLSASIVFGFGSVLLSDTV
jgi:hypothetical protein